LNAFTVLFNSGWIGYWIYKLSLAVQNHSVERAVFSCVLIGFSVLMMKSFFFTNKKTDE